MKIKAKASFVWIKNKEKILLKQCYAIVTFAILYSQFTVGLIENVLCLFACSEWRNNMRLFS